MSSPGNHRLLALLFASLGLVQVSSRGQDEGNAFSAPGADAGISQSRAWVEEIPAAAWEKDQLLRVTGADPQTRVRFAVFCNEVRDDFRRLLFKPRSSREGQARPQWSIPLQVRLWGSSQEVQARTEVLTTVEIGPDGRFVILLDVKLHDRFDEAAFQQQLVRALLIGQILVPYVQDPASFTRGTVEPPAWLTHGLDELIRHRRRGSPSSSYRGALESGQWLKPMELFAVEKVEGFDPVSDAIFRASASAMVESLLDQPDGDLGLQTLLMDFGKATPASTEALLRQHFPAFREQEQSLEKWWALELAALGQRQSYEFLDWKETERLLTEATTLSFEAIPVATPVPSEGAKRLLDLLKPKEAARPAPESFTGSIEQFKEFLHRPGLKEKLALSFNRIQSLKRVGFPLYRPVFGAYERVIVRLSRGETKDLESEIASIAEMRRKIGETVVRSEDYLNHFEATRAPLRSGAFDDYLQMRRELETKPPPKRNDPISRHLDDLEWEFR